MRLHAILGLATLSLSGFSTALQISGEPDVNDALVKQHLVDREKMISLEEKHRQGTFCCIPSPIPATWS